MTNPTNKMKTNPKTPFDNIKQNAGKREKIIKDYLFLTNLRWAEIYTRIMNGMLISADMKDEYSLAISKLDDLLQSEIDRVVGAVRFDLARLDWIKILSRAIKSRPTSWGKDVVREWRNASDEVWGAMSWEAIHKGVWPDRLQKLSSLKENDKQEEN